MLKESVLGYLLVNIVTAVLVPGLLNYVAGLSVVMYIAEEMVAANKMKKIKKSAKFSSPRCRWQNL